MNKIFIIEDDQVLREELMKLLVSHGYICSFSDDFENIIEHALNESPDLILLDLSLPYYDGHHICKEIRKKVTTPIIVVTSRNTDIDEVISLNLGADDYITKPYNTSILIAHIQTVLRRGQSNNDMQILTYKGITLNISKSIIFNGGKNVELTKNERCILALLIRNRDSIVSRYDLINELWQSDEFVDDNTLTVNVTRLRKKLEDIGAVNYIETKRGQGYIV